MTTAKLHHQGTDDIVVCIVDERCPAYIRLTPGQGQAMLAFLQRRAWVPVTPETLPPREDYVLLGWAADGSVEIGRVSLGQWVDSEGAEYQDGPSHWQPRPAGPEEEQHG